MGNYNTLSNRQFKMTFWPTVMSVIMVGTALALGTWQSQRLVWKETLIEERVSRTTLPIIELPLTRDQQVVDDISFRPVKITGTFRHDKELHFLSRDSEGRAGYMIVTPLVVEGYDDWLMVNRGWVSMPERLPENRPRDLRTKETVTITGLVRPAFKQSCLNWGVLGTYCFTPDNASHENIWFWSDFPAMQQYVGHDIVPYILEQARREDPMERPKAGQIPVYLPNNHLQYAITWFSLAIAGFMIWFLYHWRPVKDHE